MPNINFDLIYGLPHQTAAALFRTVEQCVAMEPDRIALFGYAHVPWFAKNQRMIDDGSLPTTSERAGQAGAAAATLVANGYIQVGIDHFARPADSLVIAAAEGRLRPRSDKHPKGTCRSPARREHGHALWWQENYRLHAATP